MPNHIQALDGLRGLAILLVLSFHYIGNSSVVDHGKLSHYVSHFAASGLIGVDLFFVLSGFLITGILYEALSSSNYFKTFYMRRILRIFPLYYGYLFLVVIFASPLHIVRDRNLAALLTYTQNIFLIKPYTVLWYYTGQFWSLAVEEQFYIIWPLIIYWIRDRRQLMWLCTFLSLCAIVCRFLLIFLGIPAENIYRLTPCRMDSLLIGSWLALALRGRAHSSILRAAWPLFIFSFGTYLAFRNIQRSPSLKWIYWFNGLEYTFIAIAFASILALSLSTSSLIARLFRLNALRHLGKYSYGLYVFHLASLHLASAFVMRLHPLSTWLEHLHVVPWVIAIIALAISYFLAWISYNFYESYFLKLKKHFKYISPHGSP